jgi:hypothetical protein
MVSGNACTLLYKPGVTAFLATFESDDFLFLREVVKLPMSPAALAASQSSSQRDSIERLFAQSKETQADLATTRAKLQKAEAAASLTLKEALEKWMRFDHPGMKADTTARIEMAVKMYMTDPNMHSLAKVADEFKVSRKTVSVWFKQFKEATGFQVVRYARHESVKDHLRTELENNRSQGAGDESCDDGGAE